jgi:hypothetical protein
MGKIRKLKFGGKAKLGGGVIAQNIKGWSSTGDAIDLETIHKNPNYYAKQLLKHFNLDKFVEPSYLASAEDMGVTRAYSASTILEGNPGDGIEKSKFLKYFTSDELITGSFSSNQFLSTGSYKLSFNIHGEGEKTTRPIKYYATSNHIKDILDDDIKNNLFEVSTMGDYENSVCGPYLIQSNTPGETGYFSITEPSDERIISGEITGYKGDIDTCSSQMLRFHKTGLENEIQEIYCTGLDPNYKYNINTFLDTIDFSCNESSLIDIASPIISGKKGHYFKLRSSGRADIIPYTTKVTLYKYETGFHFLTDSYRSQSDPKERRRDVHVTGARLMLNRTICKEMHVSNENSFFDLNVGSGEYKSESGYAFVGAPYTYSGDRFINYKNITITGNEDLTTVVFPQIHTQSNTHLKTIDMSNNKNLGDFIVYHGENLNKISSLNLSGCSLSGNNASMHASKVKNMHIDADAYIYPYFALPNSKNLQYLNLEGNRLNRTGVWSWVSTCLNSYYSGQLGHSGYLNIKSQTPPPQESENTAIFNNFSDNFYNNLIISGIGLLSGKNWTVEYDKS